MRTDFAAIHSLPYVFIYAALVARRLDRRSSAFQHKSLVLLGMQCLPIGSA